MAAQPGQVPAMSIFGGPTAHAPPQTQPSQASTGLVVTGMQSLGTASATSALVASSSANNTTATTTTTANNNNTYIMPNSPVRTRPVADGYRPKITRTLGQRPACLVNASVTYCGNSQIFAFGGFDQYTDEVYNHVLRLDLTSHQWSLVDNYGDIPGVRMGG